MTPSQRRQYRSESATLSERIRPFYDPNYFGYCDDCGREGHLSSSTSNLVCGTPICDDCKALRNYFVYPSTVKRFGLTMTRDQAYNAWRARRAYYRGKVVNAK